MFEVMNKLFLNFSNNFDINELDIEPFSLKIQNNRYDNHSQIETVKMPKLKPEDVQDFTVSRHFFVCFSCLMIMGLQAQ